MCDTFIKIILEKDIKAKIRQNKTIMKVFSKYYIELYGIVDSWSFLTLCNFIWFNQKLLLLEQYSQLSRNERKYKQADDYQSCLPITYSPLLLCFNYSVKCHLSLKICIFYFQFQSKPGCLVTLKNTNGSNRTTFQTQVFLPLKPILVQAASPGSQQWNGRRFEVQTLESISTLLITDKSLLLFRSQFFSD